MSDAPRISKEDVVDLLDRPGVFIIDLRSDEQWQQSGGKIPHSVREDRDNVELWAENYDPEKTLILYCA